LAEGRAQDAHRIGPMSLNLEMDRADGFQDGYIIRNTIVCVNANLSYVWLHLQNNIIT
jgi:hypothetical protein